MLSTKDYDEIYTSLFNFIYEKQARYSSTRLYLRGEYLTSGLLGPCSREQSMVSGIQLTPYLRGHNIQFVYRGRFPLHPWLADGKLYKFNRSYFEK